MRQLPLEIIVLRRAASLLSAPMFLVDPAGTLIYFNEAAEAILGRRFEEAGQLGFDEWIATFDPVDDDGHPISEARHPLAIAISRRRPAYESMTIMGLDGVARRIQLTAVPLVGISGRDLGSLAVFWPVDE